VAHGVNTVNEQKRRSLDEKVLAWGKEKAPATSIEQMGVATQKFIIEVQ
jgi:hypothetical protein